MMMELGFRRAVVVFWIVYGALFGGWEYDESLRPGQQYAEPFWPLLICTCILSPIPIVVVEVASLIWRSYVRSPHR